ncbi:hypothetical protein LRS03_17430 [Rhizobacter sp. J219]|jgi:hypothetical protein|uniref:hypothetical protein n=1 Tax=Rhizobacter sp. J219 TaxID=2898430 RepID=UPI002150E1F0|nr:hypothetical protein [Rhizobacter sp. J219]MCR5884535.1 hypothetical protein [Rhizobacter sp. J219]
MLMLPLLVAATAATGTAPATPAPGHYDAQMCVTLNANAPTCGPLQAHIDADGTLTLRVDDIRYVLSFEQGLMVGITMHGNMQIAEFLSSYRWAGHTLLFGDRSRHAQYEVQLKTRAAPP